MGFRFVLSEVDLLKNSIPAIAEIIDEGLFKVDKNGLSLLAPDRTMVSVTDFRLLSSAFEEFSVDKDESIGLNLSHFASVLKRVGLGDKLTIESGSKSNMLKITAKGSSTRTFEIPLIEVSTEKPPIDQLSFEGSIAMSSELFEEGIADAEVIGDSVILEAGPEGFSMRAKGDVRSSNLDIGKNDKGLLKLDFKEKVKAQYPLEYLKKMIKAGKIAKHLTIEFSNDYPIRLTYKVIDKAQLSFVLAPRVSEE
jgi:proliferating cell nuclear antigen